MDSIIRRFDRAPLEERLLRANEAQPPRPKGQRGAAPPAGIQDRRRGGRKHRRTNQRNEPKSAFAQELAKAL